MQLYVNIKKRRRYNVVKLMCYAIGEKPIKHFGLNRGVNRFMKFGLFLQDYVVFPLRCLEDKIALFVYYADLIQGGKYIFHMLEKEVEFRGERIKHICLIYGIDEENQNLYIVYIKNFGLRKMTIGFMEYFSKVKKGYMEEKVIFDGKFVFNTLKRVDNDD